MTTTPPHAEPDSRPRPPSPPPPSPPAALSTIDTAEFDLAFRGYRPDQVHSVLDQLRAEVVEMSVALDHARREAETARLQLRQADHRPPPPPRPPAQPLARQVVELVEQAERIVRDQFRGAAERADGIVAAAEQVAVQLTTEARAEAEIVLEAAREEAQRVGEESEARRAEATLVQDRLHATLRAAFDAVGALRDTVDADVAPAREVAMVGGAAQHEPSGGRDGGGAGHAAPYGRERPWRPGSAEGTDGDAEPALDLREPERQPESEPQPEPD